MKWEPGRQGGYEKLRLFASKWLRCDAYLIRYRQGQGVRFHRDPVAGREHWRLNIELRRPDAGGEFRTLGGRAYRFGPVALFRSDTTLHMVTPVSSGERLVLSLGAAL